jgi:type III pantothenate kinase
MILGIDVGNTNTVLGLMPAAGGPPVRSWRLSSNRDRTADEWRGILEPLAGAAVRRKEIVAVVIASVVPQVTGPLISLARDWVGFDPHVVSAESARRVTIAIDNPLEVGADRVANVVAAWDLVGGAAVVVDLGTATKIEAITADGRFVGGAIAPGLAVGRDALAARAARLFTVELGGNPGPIGANTVTAVQAGLVRGHARMIDGLVGDIRDELGLADAPVLLTGGLGAAVRDLLRTPARHVPDLTLHGLSVIARDVRLI